MKTYYLDTEFDGHHGPLLSLALVADDGEKFYYIASHIEAKDPWVREHVVPVLNAYGNGQGRYHDDITVHNGDQDVGRLIRTFIDQTMEVCFTSDSPVDIARLCDLLSTDPDGYWRSCELERITCQIVNVDIYPSADPTLIPHNALCDALALRAKLSGCRAFIRS